MRFVCSSYLINWGELKPEVQARLRDEHAELEPRICRHRVHVPATLDRLHFGD